MTGFSRKEETEAGHLLKMQITNNMKDEKMQESIEEEIQLPMKQEDGVLSPTGDLVVVEVEIMDDENTEPLIEPTMPTALTEGIRETINLLSKEETEELKKLEYQIEAGLKNITLMDEALFTISEKRLYREKSKTFEEYCLQEWGLTYRRVKQRFDAAQVIKNLNHGSDHPPENERQVRPLVKLSPEDQRLVWEMVIRKKKGKKPTGKDTEKGAAEHLGEIKSEKICITIRNLERLIRQITDRKAISVLESIAEGYLKTSPITKLIECRVVELERL